MINLNNEMAYINWYVAQKEYFLTEDTRRALNKIFNFISKKKLPKAVAIHVVNNLFKKKGTNFGKRFLHSKYNARLAHIKNAKDEFAKWELDFRMRHFGMKKKLCECGCGQEVTKKTNRFIHGHHRRILSQEEKEANAKRMRDIRASKQENKVIDIKSYKNL